MSWKIAPIGRGGDLLYSQAGTPSLDLRFAEKKALTDYVSGDNLVTFSRSSNATYVDSDGLIKTAATNTPRFDHDPTTGESLGLLVEEARTNILLNSATLSTQSVTTSATTYTLSFYGTGTVTLSGTSTAGPLIGIGSGAANRVALTFTPTAGTLTLTITGTVSNAQLETGSFPTSYIPTTGATATRTADVVSITGTNFSSWYNQSEGTLVCQYDKDPANGAALIFGLTSATDADRLMHYFRSSGTQIRFDIQLGGANQSIISINNTNPSVYKVAFGIKAQDIKATLNGASPVADASLPGNLPTVDRLLIGTTTVTAVYRGIGHVSRLTYYPVRLPDATLQTITS